MPISFSDAQKIILEKINLLSSETVRLTDATGRVLAEDVVACFPLPHWDNSAMDGYAVRDCDCLSHRQLHVTGFIQAGESAEGVVVKSGCAVKIMTGAPTPEGCTAVVPVEETVAQGDFIEILGAVQPGDHVRKRGEDVAEGERAVAAGTVLRPAEISMLAALGRRTVAVYRQVRVAIVSTGDELVELGEPLGAGQIYDANLVTLAATVTGLGARPVSLGIAHDNHESLRQAFTVGLQADVLITTAGVSMGDKDLVRQVLEELGVEPVFWKVQVKPGRPTAFGLKDGRPVFSLPGNPVSSLLTCEFFVKPALLKMMGHRQVMPTYFKARLKDPYEKKSGRVNLMRVHVTRGPENTLVAENAGDQNTGMLSTLLNANGVAVLPAEQAVFPAGSIVDVHLFEPVQDKT